MNSTQPGREPDAATFADEAPVPRWVAVALDEAIVRCDHAGRIVETAGAAGLLPADQSTLIGRRIADVESLPTSLRQAWQTAIDRCLDTQRAQIAAYRHDHGDGERAFEARVLPVDGGAVVAIRDVGERDGLRERVEWLATHDVVTGLANVRVLRERLTVWMRGGVAMASTPVALLIVDLDRFKQANDLHGRSIGDSLLRLASQRLLREAAGEVQGLSVDRDDPAASIGADEAERIANLVVARLGGDQFAIAWRLEGRSDAVAAAGALASRLIGVLGTPTRIAGQTLFMRASVGIALYPNDAPDPAALLSQAEGALKRAKQGGRNQFRHHGDVGAQDTAHPPADESAMRAALAAGQFSLVYQPKFELASSLSSQLLSGDARRSDASLPLALIAIEALVRWRTPAGALLAPRDFIPLAETSGMIRPLGEWVLRTALAEASRFVEQGATRVGVAVNVSLLQLHDRLFVETVADALGDFGFAPDELTLELAETAFVDDVRLVADTVAELSALGVRLAIDHFGVGTAGFVALKSLPIDEIKIDRSFIAGAAIDAFDATMVAGLIEMAHNLGKTVTADGVERVDQVAALNQMRCDAIQGFFVGEPMTAVDLVAARSLWRHARGDRRDES